jgi:hypothetical protein
LAKRICTELTVHTTIEEEIFYPACKGKIEDDLLSEGYAEHTALRGVQLELGREGLLRVDGLNRSRGNLWQGKGLGE